MALLGLEDVHVTLGDRHLLRGVSFLVADQDRVGIVGANGSGKSTLLRLLAGDETPDEGARTVRRDLVVGYLSQEPALDPGLPVRDIVRLGLAGRETVLAELDRVHAAMAAPGCPESRLERLLSEQAALEDRLHGLGGHDVEHRVESLIHSVGLLDPDAMCGELSGGERRRAAIARLLIGTPDLLLLDEPTNHLDAEVIAWLEDELRTTRAALVLVTHDRYFLDRVVDRIVELEQGVLHEYSGSYGDFLIARAERLEREQKEESTRQNLLRRETAWIRRGPPARTTKSKSRIQRYEALVDAAPEADAGELSFRIPCEHRLGERVLELHGIAKAFDGRTVLKDLDLEIARGERLGIVGPNGAGKTTLLKLCTGALEPDAGQVTVGPTVRFSYVDQSRSALRDDLTVVETIGQGNDHVFVDGRKLRVETYLERFLFASAMMRTRVGELSGGERNRVLIALLLSMGGNVLVLDEPTNDLDLMTLRVLEEALCAFPGSALIVSHDRWFLDRVATRVLWLGAGGEHETHTGDVSDLLERRRERASTAARANARAAVKAPEPATPSPAKLTWTERRELEALPDRITVLEDELRTLDGRLADPDLYANADPAELQRLTARRGAAQDETDALLARWEELEGRSG